MPSGSPDRDRRDVLRRLHPVRHPAHQLEHAVDACLCPPDLLGRRQVDLGQRDDHRQLHGQQDAEVLPGDVGHAIVGGDDQQAVVQLLADDAANGRPQPGLMAYRVDKRDDLVRLCDDVGALLLVERVIQVDDVLALDAVDGVG